MSAEPQVDPDLCMIRGCHEARACRDVCRKHWERWRRTRRFGVNKRVHRCSICRSPGHNKSTCGERGVTA